jgi:hypothetical protein
MACIALASFAHTARGNALSPDPTRAFLGYLLWPKYGFELEKGTDNAHDVRKGTPAAFPEVARMSPCVLSERPLWRPVWHSSYARFAAPFEPFSSIRGGVRLAFRLPLPVAGFFSAAASRNTS